MDIVCISHLWWSWVWQRPQHLIGRLAQDARVLWAEEPHLEIGPPGATFEITREQPNLEIGRLMLRSDADTFWERLDETVARVNGAPIVRNDHLRDASYLFGSPAQRQLEDEIVRYVQKWRQGPLVLWLYTPVVIDLIDQIQPDLVVYDVMDELSAFRFAPPQLKAQEQQLLARADLVFTGGPSMYEARIGRHSDVHLFPSGVEQEHFAQAVSPDLAVAPEVADLPHPIIGFYGVIDERIDLPLLARVAEQRPAWQWVMVGPVLKLSDDELPRLPNIHYLGKQDYAQLPAFLKGFDVAMMPFARNQATRFISPTKTLEYLAAHKPIVSTSIKDVIDLYGDVVRIADEPDAFVAAIEAALNERVAERAARDERARDLLDRYAWDRIAGDMRELIVDRLARA